MPIDAETGVMSKCLVGVTGWGMESEARESGGYCGAPGTLEKVGGL